ncbi:hypothetical protein HYX18_03385 [Candidatus Woesearchaeota archaeon]|nr:hypothetical protein [Candidatus Woesearchaeota archaeon]
MVETRDAKNKINEALNRILINEDSDVFARKLEHIVSVCKEKIDELRNSKNNSQ